MTDMTKSYRIIKRKQHTGEPGNGGQFGRDPKAEAGIELGAEPTGNSPELDKVLASVEAAPFVHDLVFVERDDRLTDEQIGDFLAGRHSEVEVAIDDVFSEIRADNEIEAAKEFCRDADVEWDDLDDDEQMEIRGAILDRDTSDPVKDLLHGTGDQLMRAKIAGIGEAAMRQAYADGEDVRFGQNDVIDGRVKLLSSLLAEQGMEVTGDAAQAALREIIGEQSPYDWHEGVTLEVIWYGPVGEASAAPRSDTEFPGAAGRNLTFATPSIILLDTWNGQGYEATVPAQLTVAVTPDSPAKLDNADAYGWDAIAGVVKGAYRTDITSEFFAAKELVTA